MNKGLLARLSLAVLCLAVGWPVLAADFATHKADISRSLDARYARIDALYKDIHTRPELSFQETGTAKAVAMMSAAPEPEIRITAGAKPVVNDDALAARSGGVLKAAFGERARQLPEPGSASEDYSEFVIAGVPSFYFGIGGLDPKVIAEAAANKTPVPGNHSPEFAPVPEPTIRTGAEAMSLVVLDILQKK